MSNMLNIIKQAALDAVRQTKPTEVTFGTVVKTIPLEIKIHQKLIIKGDSIASTENINWLLGGEKVVLLRVQGGQQYVIIGRLV